MITNDDIDTLARATAYSPDGDKLGRVGEVYLDNETGQPGWITIVTGLFGTRRHFVPIDEAVLDSSGVRLPYDKDTITGAPNIDENGELTPLEEDELYRYYRRSGSDSGSSHDTRGTSAGAPHTGTAPTGTAHAGTPQSGQPGTIPGPSVHTPSAGRAGSVPPDVAREEIAGNYHPSEGQRDETLEHSMPGRTSSMPATASGTAPHAQPGRHAETGEGTGIGTPQGSGLVGPGPTGPAHAPSTFADKSPSAKPGGADRDKDSAQQGDSSSDRPRKPRLVKRVITTEYYEEEPGDDSGDSNRS